MKFSPLRLKINIIEVIFGGDLLRDFQYIESNHQHTLVRI